MGVSGHKTCHIFKEIDQGLSDLFVKDILLLFNLFAVVCAGCIEACQDLKTG